MKIDEIDAKEMAAAEDDMAANQFRAHLEVIVQLDYCRALLWPDRKLLMSDMDPWLDWTSLYAPVMLILLDPKTATMH